MITAEVTTIRYATIGPPQLGSEFRVYPNGDVHKWENANPRKGYEGHWRMYGQSEHRFDEIQQAGLEALENEKAS